MFTRLWDPKLYVPGFQRVGIKTVSLFNKWPLEWDDGWVRQMRSFDLKLMIEEYKGFSNGGCIVQDVFPVRLSAFRLSGKQMESLPVSAPVS